MESFSKKIRVRFSPSPTGYLHVGGVRTALFNWLFAKQNNGVFILRIEDTDKERSRPEYEADILEGLSWIGLNWDEGPVTTGAFGTVGSYKNGYGPYRQSERTDIYEKYLKQLFEEKKAYWCFCTKEELDIEKQSMMAQGLPPKYSGRCRNLDQKEVEKKLEAGESAVIRFRVSEATIEFNDLIRNKVKFDASLMGDQVIAKNFSTPLYNFSVVIDDFLMEITHVIRGEEHITNTPKQILLQKALGFSQPIYAHLPLILAADKSKLSKRAGDTSLKEYREKGYLKEALINFLVLLGWHSSDDREIMSISDMIKEFSFKRVQKSGAVFNPEKLEWMNASYIKALPMEELIKDVKDFIPKEWHENRILEGALKAERERMRLLSDFRNSADFFFNILDYPKELLRWQNSDDEKIKRNLNAVLDIFEKESFDSCCERIMNFAEINGRGDVLWPLRAALSGRRASPSPFEIIAVLGKEESIRRIKIAISKFS